MLKYPIKFWLPGIIGYLKPCLFESQRNNAGKTSKNEFAATIIILLENICYIIRWCCYLFENTEPHRSTPSIRTGKEQPTFGRKGRALVHRALPWIWRECLIRHETRYVPCRVGKSPLVHFLGIGVVEKD